MNIVEKEAEKFIDNFFIGAIACDIEDLKDSLTSKLYNFNRDKDKLFFLNVLRKEVEKEKLVTQLDAQFQKKKKLDCLL